jgi:hypothetical protein
MGRRVDGDGGDGAPNPKPDCTAVEKSSMISSSSGVCQSILLF